VHAKQAAAGERLIVELDVPAAHGLALIAHAARRQHHGAALFDGALDILDRAEITTLGLIADDVLDGIAGDRHSGRHFQLFHELVVAEQEVEVGIEQDDAVVHVVEDGLHHSARALDIFLGESQSLLTILELGDVAIDAKHAAVGQMVVVEFDIVAVDRAPLVAAAARIADDRRDLLNLAFDLIRLQRAVLAALRLEADHVVA
jgi:hypothetical protein